MRDWFPIIGLQFPRLQDLLFVVLAIGLIATIIASSLVSVRRMLHCISKPLTTLTLHAITCAWDSAKEMATYVFVTIQHVPLAWYPTATLTIIPMIIDIPRWAAVLFLLSYCVTNAWLMACGIKDVRRSIEPIKPKSNHLFAGMRITVQ